ncbi:hypothetical protein EI613_06325 [Azospirillum sp. 412522]|nr:hypothetical protein [Azospirillum sp. 412522]MBY6261545.1 hypothetical protein [Azospirillum sp. 412522]
MTGGSGAVPESVTDWMRRLGGIAGAMVLVMLGLLLWSGAAAAACPHDRAGSSAAVASHHVSHAMGAERTGNGRYMPGRSHHALQPCCAGMACAALAVGLLDAEVMSPPGSTGPRLGWASGPLREGLGLRPDLPPPRLG